MAYVVLPPAAPVALDVPPMPAALAAIYTIAGLDGPVAGEPLDLTISARGLSGQPVPHSEIDTQLLEAAGVPILMTKLHTHSDGDFSFTLTLPAAGDYTLRLTPFPLDQQADAAAYGTTLGGSLDFPIHAAAGTPLPVASETSGPAQDAPLVGAPILFAVLAVLVIAVRRRA
jgi:hypothetical protein